MDDVTKEETVTSVEVDFDDTAIQELEKSVTELVETLKLEQDQDDPSQEKLDELLDFYLEKEQKEKNEKDVEIEKLSNIEELLSEEELTEEQQAELDALLADEEDFFELQKAYYAFQVSNQNDLHESILTTNDQMIELKQQQNDLIVEGFLSVIITIVVVKAINVLITQMTKW